MGQPFFKPKQDICRVRVECFYIVGTAEERAEKYKELIKANPLLSCVIRHERNDLSVTALQLSSHSFSGAFEDIKARAEAGQLQGKNCVFLISPVPQAARFVELDLGIDYSQAPSLKGYKKNRQIIDFSGYEPCEDGVMRKVTVVSVKKKRNPKEIFDNLATSIDPESEPLFRDMKLNP